MTISCHVGMGNSCYVVTASEASTARGWKCAEVDYLSSLADSFAEVAEEPAEEEEADESEIPIPPFYQPLYDATQAVAVGDLEVEEWMAIWQQVGAALEGMSEQIAAQVAHVGLTFGEETKAAGELLLDGLESALEALSEMGEYLEDDDPEHLDQGWGDLLESSQLIARATHEFQTLRNQIKPK